jgi:hypothetical protein
MPAVAGGQDVGIDALGATLERRTMKNMWWVSMTWSPEWSDAETSARTRILGLSSVFFLLLFIPEALVFNAVGIDHHIGAFVAFAVAVPPAFFAGRRMSERLWPELLKRADGNAARRFGR